MFNTTQLSPADTASTSRGFGRQAARTKVGSGPHVIHAALKAARAEYPAVDSNEFVAGFHDERNELLQG